MTNGRTKALIEDLERALIDWMRRHRIDHGDYRRATDLIVASIKAGEESLLFDVFLEAEATDIGNVGRSGSPEAIEGPFYMRGAPMLDAPHVMPQRPGERGSTMLFHGETRDVDGSPITGVEIDVWHADADGRYSNIHPGIPDWNLRGRFVSDDRGQYAVRTILPPPYEIPKNGPTGVVLGVLGRHCFRPAHLHVKVSHPSYGAMTSQLYFEGGEYLESDVANAVRDGLVLPVVRHADGDAPATFSVRYDFVLARLGGKVHAAA